MFPGMRTHALAAGAAALVLGLAACAKIPTHSGYKNDKVKPWKKPEVLAFDEKGEVEDDGELDYKTLKRAKWYALDLAQEGELELELEISPGLDDDGFDLAMEVLDPNFNVISKADLEEDDANELLKTRTLYELSSGRYLIHLYLQRRIDSAEYDLKVRFTSQAKAYASDFPANVAFPPRLALVPPIDDTPAGQIGRRPPRDRDRDRDRGPKPPKPPKEGNKLSGKVINVVVSGSESLITIDKGTLKGVEDGMTGYVQGVKDGRFTTSSCNERNCKGKVSATPDQISKSGKVLIVGVKPPPE
jgi:hypothetical protein